MFIPYRDLSVTDFEKKESLLKSVEQVLSHGRIILGPEVEVLERYIAEFCSARYAVGVNSGTGALYLALRCLDVGPGDEVITTPLSWIATLNAIVLTGATPVFVDISKDLNINANLIKSAVTSKTKVILPVHYTGKLCDMKQILDTAVQNDIYVVEDGAQAFGANINGQRAGSFGHINCFSMNPMKIFCAYGEAGAIVTDDETFYQKLLSLRYAGAKNKEDCYYPSINGRIDTIQAAMMLVEFQYLEKKIDRIQEIAKFYSDALKNIIICPEADESYHVYYSYTVITEARDELRTFLKTKGIETKIQHPILMPYHSAYKYLPEFEIPVAKQLVNRILCIPNHEKLTNKETEYIVCRIREFFGKS